MTLLITKLIVQLNYSCKWSTKYKSFYKKKTDYSKCFVDRAIYMMICTVYIMFGLAFTSTIIEIVR